MIHATLATIVGDKAVQSWDHPRWADYFVEPPPIVYPTSVEALAEVVACASQENWPLLPLGYGTKLTWFSPSRHIKVLVSTAALHQIKAHAIADLTVTAAAGICFHQLQTQLASAGQFIAVDPHFSDLASLGGIAASRDSGSLGHGYGTLRDHCLGIQFVRADGKIAKAGARVVKNVAGYDLMKLMIGSFGTLGILTELTLRVYPLPEAKGTWLLTGELNVLNQALRALLQSTLTPASVDLLTGESLEAVYPEAQNQNLGVALRVQFHGLAPLLEPTGAIAQRMEALGQDYQLTCVKITNTAVPSTIAPEAIAMKVGCLPQHSLTLIRELLAQAQAQKLSLNSRMQAGRGVGVIEIKCQEVLSLKVDQTTLKKQEQLQTFFQWGRSRCQTYGGYLTLLQADSSFRESVDGWGYTGNALTLMKKIKQQFDPTGLFNPGAFIGGL